MDDKGQDYNESKDTLNAYLIQEFCDLTQIIARMRDTISTFQHQNDDHFCFKDTPDALESIIVATASATHTILDSIEKLEMLKPFLNTMNQGVLIARIARMYEVCIFQDINGQRITKVIRALRRIELELTHFFDAYADYINNGDKENKGVSEAFNKDFLVDLQRINMIIQLNKQEMSMIQSAVKTAIQFNDTHKELDAVIQSTNDANRILRECMHDFQTLDTQLMIDDERMFKQHIAAIHDVCAFQDVINQCIENVINTLKGIDGTLNRIFNDYEIRERIEEAKLDRLPIDSLMNGPQLPKDGHNQAMIDTIFTTPMLFEK